MQKHWRGILIGIAVMVCSAIVYLGVSSWFANRDALVKAQAQAAAQAAAQQQIVQQQRALAASLEKITDSVNTMQAEQAARMKSLEDRFTRSNTPQEVATLVASLMNLKQPVTFVTPPATAENPHPAPLAQISTEDTQQVKTYVQGCETCKIDLDTRTKQLTYSEQRAENLNQQLALKDLTLESKDKEIVAWQTAARGGTGWQRFFHTLKDAVVYGAVGAGVTAAAICGSGHCK